MEKSAMVRNHAKDQNDQFEGRISNSRVICNFLKTMSHEGRLRILCNLADGEKSVLGLESSLPYRQAAISQQLARLRFEGFVDFRRQGKTRYYHIKDLKVLKFINLVNEEFN